MLLANLAFASDLLLGNTGKLVERAYAYTNQNAMNQAVHAASVRDDTVLDELISTGEAVVLGKGTSLSCIEREVSSIRVRVLDGSQKGDSLYLPMPPPKIKDCEGPNC